MGARGPQRGGPGCPQGKPKGKKEKKERKRRKEEEGRKGKKKEGRAFHSLNFGIHFLKPLDLLNKIISLNLESVFPYISIALQILLTLTVTVASAERSFSKLKLIKNHELLHMGQERLVDLAILGIESDLAKSVDFNNIINLFAAEKARRVAL